MSNNLQNFNDIYASLSQSAYPDNPNSFNFDDIPKDRRRALKSGKSIDFNYSQSATHTYGKNGDKTHITQGGQGLPNDGVVYLQPEDKKRTVA